MIRIAPMLRLYLAVHDISQKRAALDIGVSESTLSRFLAEKNTPDGEAVAAVIRWCLTQHEQVQSSSG